MSLPKSYKQQVLEKLRLLQDEPDADSNLFQFGRFAEQISNLLSDKTAHTPFTVALHGEWGSGKTSLMKKSYELLKKKIEGENVKIIWFDAWEYERLDPTSALISRIANEYSDKNTRFKEVVKGLVYVFSDIALRANAGLTLDEFTGYFESSIKEIETITSELEKMIGNSKLIVFVDDLDRCLVDNALRILEAIKLFLNAKGIMFVVAVDMKKLERAWHLRYGGLREAELEGREHVEKIFQLKLLFLLK